MDTFVDVLANVIIQQYFISSRCLLIFTDRFNTFYYTGNVPVVKIEIESENVQPNVIFHNFGCQEIVVKTSRPLWLLRTFENDIKLTLERFNRRRYLFIPGNVAEENLTDIFNMKELDYISDLVVIEEEEVGEEEEESILPKLDGIYNLWTHRYVGTIDNNDKLLLDVWFSKNNSFKYGGDLYPNKLINQIGRTLRMATFQYEPYSIIGSTVDQYYGSEMSTAVAFAKMYNMTPVPVVNPEDYWGEIFDNWTGNGLLGNLAADKADIGFGALYTWEVDYHFLDLSKPLVRTGITCLVPAPTLAAGWLTPLYSYSLEMWTAVGALFITSFTSLFLIHYFNTKMNSRPKMQIPEPRNSHGLLGESIFSIFKLFILQAVTKEEIPRGVSGSYFMGLLFLFSLFLTSTYSSGFSTIMTIPRYENPINTVEEFSSSGIPWGATQDAWITSIEKVEEPVYKEIVRRFNPISEEKLREYSKTGKFAFSVERLPHENYAIGSYIKEDEIGNFHLMKDDLYWEQCVVMARKSSILLPLLDMFILRVFEAGLISYWQNEAVLLSMDGTVQKAVKFYHYHNEKNVVKLKWIHVEGAFGALCLGYVISTMGFLLEIFLSKLKTSKFHNHEIEYTE